MTFAERTKRLYMYGRSDLFKDRSALRRANVLHDAAVSALEAAVIATESSRLAVDYLKGSLKIGDVVNIPRCSFELAQSADVIAPVDHDHSSWLKVLKQKPEGMSYFCFSGRRHASPLPQNPRPAILTPPHLRKGDGDATTSPLTLDSKFQPPSPHTHLPLPNI